MLAEARVTTETGTGGVAKTPGERRASPGLHEDTVAVDQDPAPRFSACVSEDPGRKTSQAAPREAREPPLA